MSTVSFLPPGDAQPASTAISPLASHAAALRLNVRIDSSSDLFVFYLPAGFERAMPPEATANNMYSQITGSWNAVSFDQLSQNM
ncbi:hypothetical protein IPU70_02845 [Achromobacter sp. SD115]|uniref:hypothetical protein n=1 Tax=Achromobacter sp. SD115 TaxID=2782011 RepID=UPI001A973E91|nr:hypothetical protein [Achromobacter sp. SD115]MBO1012470.1 hypothetical protein [Achromobacter sp. SD115]